MILAQIFDLINIGIVILKRDLKVYKWNRWMELHSEIDADEIIGFSVLDFFPNLNTPKFLRSCKSVLTLGNFCFFSQRLHHYLFPCKSASYFDSKFEYMQQSCAMGPLRDRNNKIKYLYIYVHDVTEVADYEQKLLEMNMKDGLTEIYNRRFLEIRLKEEFERHKRYSRPFSIIMFDIDFFKKINDVHGHQCGDFVLKSISSIISSIVRETDCLSRYGGEEFCCLLPETGLDSALEAAERFRIAILEQENSFSGCSVKVTISLGVAELREEFDSPDILLKKADEALYEAKRTGRNRVVAMS